MSGLPEITTLFNELPAYRKLQKHAAALTNPDKRFNIAEAMSEERVEALTYKGPFGFHADLSKNFLTPDTIALLQQLAEEAKLPEWINAMFQGKQINTTEKRAAAHIALRVPEDKNFDVLGRDVVPDVQKVLKQIENFSEAVRSGEHTGFTGKKIKDAIHIGIGGSELGPHFACDALKPSPENTKFNLHFVANVDGSALEEKLALCNPETTLIIIASKTFTTQETMANAELARQWFLDNTEGKGDISKHFAAISTNAKLVKKFGIADENRFEFWDWVGGRYSTSSAIGMLPLALQNGMETAREFLAGAHEMDEYFYRETQWYDNLATVLALVNIWYINFLHCKEHAHIAYDHYLSLFVNHLQQLSMESLGKSRTQNGDPLVYQTGATIWGGVGSIVQHSFHQLFHQGSFIMPITFWASLDKDKTNGDLLFKHCLAQSAALMKGKTEKEAQAEIAKKLVEQGTPKLFLAKELARHKTIPGNRPSTTICYDKLDAKTLGALFALNEHVTAIKGFIWNINPFDQFGVELGKQLCDEMETTEQDASTAALLKLRG